MEHEHAGPRRRDPLVEGEIAPQISGVTVVIDVVRLHWRVVSFSHKRNRKLHTRLKQAQPGFSEHRLSVFGEHHAPHKSAARAASQKPRPRIALGAT
jgi:hypothetical protein